MNRNDAEFVIKDTIEYANNEIKKSKENFPNDIPPNNFTTYNTK